PGRPQRLARPGKKGGPAAAPPVCSGRRSAGFMMPLRTNSPRDPSQSNKTALPVLAGFLASGHALLLGFLRLPGSNRFGNSAPTTKLSLPILHILIHVDAKIGTRAHQAIRVGRRAALNGPDLKLATRRRMST